MTSTMWKQDWIRPRRTGYRGAFGDSFFSDCWDVVERPGKKIIQEDVTSDVPEENVKSMFRKSHLSRMNSWDEIYQVMLDVRHFTPSDLAVKLVNDKEVIVEGKHGERKDPEGFVSREFTRKYNLPDSVIPSTVECFLSSDGVLVIRGQAGKKTFHKGNLDLLETNIPIFKHRYEYDSKTKPNNSSSQPALQERIIPITLEERVDGHRESGSRSSRSCRSSTRDEMRDRMTPQVGEQSQNHEDPLNFSVSTNEYSTSTGRARTEKERAVSFDESYDESVGSERVHSGRNSRMSDEVFDGRSPYLMDEGRLHQTNENAFISSTQREKLKDFITNHHQSGNSVFEHPLVRRGLQDAPRSIPFLKDLFSDIIIPNWKNTSVDSPLASKAELHDKNFEKGYKNGIWTESFEERFCSEQYSMSSSQRHRDQDDRSIANAYKPFETGSLSHHKERLIKISSPA